MSELTPVYDKEQHERFLKQTQEELRVFGIPVEIDDSVPENTIRWGRYQWTIRDEPAPAYNANPASTSEATEFEDYLLSRRESLADELRAVESILIRRGKITRVLCAPGRTR